MPWSFLQPAPILRLPRVPQSAVISLAYKRHSMATESLRVLRVVCGTTPPPKSLQSCPTLCNPINSSPPGSSVPGILQARTLEWVAISFSNAWKWKVKVKSLSRVWLLVTPWTAAYQASPSVGFSRQEYWSGVPLPSPMWNHIQRQNIYLLYHSNTISLYRGCDRLYFPKVATSLYHTSQALLIVWCWHAPWIWVGLEPRGSDYFTFKVRS